MIRYIIKFKFKIYFSMFKIMIEFNFKGCI